MRCKRTVKIVIDMAMYLIFVALMQEHLWSDGLHEWLGITLFTLFIAHTVLNFRWYQSLFKGRQSGLEFYLSVQSRRTIYMQYSIELPALNGVLT